jgi:hypothetical protein
MFERSLLLKIKKAHLKSLTKIGLLVKRKTKTLLRYSASYVEKFCDCSKKMVYC